MVIEIKVTPRRIERFFFVVLLMVFMTTTILYAYRLDKAQGAAGAAITGEVILETNVVAETVEEELFEVILEPEVEEEVKTIDLSGELSIDIGPLKYDFIESGIYKKAVIERLSFVVDNGLDEDLDMYVKVFAFDKNSPDSHKNYPKDTINFSVIASGSRMAKTYEIKNLNLYNTELAKTIKFEFYNEDDKLLKLLSKTLKLED